MRKIGLTLVALALVATGCTAGGAGSERIVLVDYQFDEFATSLFKNFPATVDATPGMTVVFKQAWTGEPHTVTGGTTVNELMEKAEPWMDFFNAFGVLAGSGVGDPEERPSEPASAFFDEIDGSDEREARERFYAAYDALRDGGVPLVDREDPGDATQGELVDTVNRFSEEILTDIGLPWAFGERNITQNGGQPCYLRTGLPPKTEDEPCAKAQQRQPAFDGTESYYNSGIIPYEGPEGNTFRMKLADDIEPGTYWFYCAVHGPDQSTELVVKPAGAKIEDQADTNRRALKEIEEFAAPMVRAFDDAKDNTFEFGGGRLEGPFAGLSVPVFGILNEMVPKTIRARVGEKVTWKLMGADHSISFNVPRYFPIMKFGNDGTIELNERIIQPAGGSPPLPDDQPIGPEDRRQGIISIDGGTYDGTGYWSSGLFSSEPYAEYSLRFSRPGTYKYACLLHPPMVGTVVVS